MKIGEPAVDFTLLDQDSRPVSLAGAWASGPACLVFYPGDFTAVCTAQLCSYRDRWDDFLATGATLLGINRATQTSHADFAREHKFPFPLLSDPDGACCDAYGAAAWWGTRRVIVIIDSQGIVRHHDAIMPLLRQDPEAVLAAIREAT